MKTLRLSVCLFSIYLFFLSSCSGETVGVEKEKEQEETTELKFHANLIGLWESEEYRTPNELPGGTKGITEITYKGCRCKVTILINSTSVVINEDQTWIEIWSDPDDSVVNSEPTSTIGFKGIKELTNGMVSQKCELREVKYPYYTIRVIEGKHLGKNMVFKFIPEKGAIEWEVHLPLGYVDNPKMTKVAD